MGVRSLIGTGVFFFRQWSCFQGEGDEAGSGAEEEEEDHVHGIQFGLYEPIAVEQVEDGADAEPDHVRIDENRLLNTLVSYSLIKFKCES